MLEISILLYIFQFIFKFKDVVLLFFIKLIFSKKLFTVSILSIISGC